MQARMIFLWCARVQPSRTFTSRVMEQAWQDEAHRRMTRLFSPSAQRRSQQEGLDLTAFFDSGDPSNELLDGAGFFSYVKDHLVFNTPKDDGDGGQTWSSNSRMAPPCSRLAM